eukprot:3019862-Rhodomonas_salina.1
MHGTNPPHVTTRRIAQHCDPLTCDSEVQGGECRAGSTELCYLLRARYGMSGTDLCYVLRASYGLSGTKLCPTECVVLTFAVCYELATDCAVPSYDMSYGMCGTELPYVPGNVRY